MNDNQEIPPVLPRRDMSPGFSPFLPSDSEICAVSAGFGSIRLGDDPEKAAKHGARAVIICWDNTVWSFGLLLDQRMAG